MTPFTDELAFLAAVRAAPADDAPRLIYADWLDEQDDDELTARAEFIRVQCDRVVLPPDDSRQERLEVLENGLYHEMTRSWKEPLLEAFPHERFHRGFIDRHRIPLRMLMGWGEVVVRMIGSSRLSVCDAEKMGDRLATCPWLQHWIRLDVSDNRLHTEDIEALAASPYLSFVEELVLAGNPFRYPAVVALSESPHLARLRTLDLSRTQTDSLGATAIAVSAHLIDLRTLRLNRSGIGPEGVESLCFHSVQSLLHTLELRQNRFLQRGVRALATATRLRNLKHLDLRHNNLYDEERTALIERYGTDVCLF